VSITVKTYPRLAEAASALSHERGARFLAGGTLVMRAVNEVDPSIETIVRSTDPSFVNIAVSSGRVEFGAGVTMAAILDERELGFLHPVARAVGGPAVREAATVGGNLFAHSPYGDFAAALLALDATVMLVGGVGQRELPLDEFLSRRERNGAALVASVAFKRPASDAFRFAKITRVHPKGISVLSIAGQLPLASGRVSGARIAYGAMGPVPVRAKTAERALEGRALDAAGIAPALAAAHDGTSPADDAIASAWWRREILPIHLRRLLLGEYSMRHS
jgi:xanthine dehydrogenase small subunit